MKKFGLFILGFLTGVCVTILTLLVISKTTAREGNELNTENSLKYFNNQEYKNIDGLNISSEPGKAIDAKKIIIFQTFDTFCGLAYVCKNIDEDDYLNMHALKDLLVFYVATDENSYLYDDEVIDVDENSEVVQVGTYRYKTVNKEYDQYKTVPVVIIKEKTNTGEII